MDFKWKTDELIAPELNNDFKWRFGAEMLKPKLQIEGPGVGSLLYAMNPATSELGLKQMDSELNQQLAANENFDKRGDAAMKFMEQRVAEDIAGKQFAEKMALEQQKIQNVDAGHFNSLMSNYSQALQNGDARQIAILEDQIMKTIPNGKQFIEQGREIANKGIQQQSNFYNLASEIPTGTLWENRTERDNYIEKVQNSDLNEKQKSDLITKARSINDKSNYKEMQSFNARVNNTVNRNINVSNAGHKENWMKQNRKNFRSQKAADEEYARLFGGK